MLLQITSEEVAQELRVFMAQWAPPEGEGDTWCYLPSLQHLREKGEEELALKLKRSKKKQIAALLGVEARQRGWPKGRQRKQFSHCASDLLGKQLDSDLPDTCVSKVWQSRKVTAQARAFRHSCWKGSAAGKNMVLKRVFGHCRAKPAFWSML